MKAIYYGRTNIGNIRPKNEDAFVLNDVWGGSHLLAVVVDGVGGNGGGDVASNLAVRCISEHFRECMHSVNSIDVLQSAVIFANNSIYAQHYNPWLSQMSCVLTAALINLKTGKMDVCHVGDTRLYMLKDQILTKITSDHSFVGPMEESGQLTELEAMDHPRRNIITRSVGKDILQWGTEYIQTHTIMLEPDSTLLLCSDGLYDMVHSSRTVEILSEPISVDKRVDKLIDAALEAGGKDNVTVLVIDLIK
ncbi:MAG: serine/threonine-protein phosphatase [Bacteroidales bacterium]|jgi:serine/threonine protein phosphatase PrpC|nr:serine/threonine-protein phosphatase [Bacteroidales bacterium]